MSQKFGAAAAVRRFLADERGSAYTISYVMTLPLVVLLVAASAETAMILTARIGVGYAAFSAARSAAVWLPAGGEDAAQRRARQAAAQALIPFANGLQDVNGPPVGSTDSLQEAWLEYHAASYAGSVSPEYLRRKCRYAHAMTTVAIEKSRAESKESWDYDVNAVVTYKYSFHCPLFGLFFSDGKLTMTAAAKLKVEAPKNAAESLGISYASP